MTRPYEVDEVVEVPTPILVSGAAKATDIPTLAHLEKNHIERAMFLLDNDKPKVASALGISLKTLYNKLNTYKKSQE